MPPDADKLRLRRKSPAMLATGAAGPGHGDNDIDDLAVSPADGGGGRRLPARALQDLKGHEVCVDGVVYDLTSFDHPGGGSIFLFGGNDVTTQYRMIHPHHMSSKHLQKMAAVGAVPGHSSEYKFGTEFERELKREVFRIVPRGREFGTPGYLARALLYVSVFLYLQYLWMARGTSLPLAVLYGVAMALVGLNVQHDANHGAASRAVWVNDLLGLGADLIGGSRWLWMQKHWTHHAYTNHRDKDPDGFAAEPLVLFNDYGPDSPKRAWHHAFQAFYVVLVLSGYWLSSVLDLPVVWSLQDRGAVKVGMRLDNDWIASRSKAAVGLRFLYYVCNIVLPLCHDCSWRTVGHINVMGVSGSLTLGLLFTLSHNFEGADRDPTAEARKNGEPVCWYQAQVETSSTYGGTAAGWLTGGLNFQVEHHLFPRMSSAWYPSIAPTVRRVCEKHGVRYAYYPWVWQNMYSTLKYTHEVGNGSHWKGNPFKGDM